MTRLPTHPLTIAMLSLHSNPVGALGTRDTGGMSVYVREIAREMGRKGHRVDIFTRRWHDDEPAVARLAPHVRLVSLDIAHYGLLSKATLYSYAGDFAAAIDRFRHRQGLTYDLIHSHYWLSGHVGRMIHRRWQRPHVITFHTLGALKADTGVGAAEPVRRLAVEKELVQACDGLLAPCEGEKTNLMHYYRADPVKIAMVPGGVDLVRFRPLDQTMARRQLGLDPEGFMLLSVGRLAPLKGQDRIIEALTFLGDHPRPQLMIVGGNGTDDPERRRLETIAARAGLLSRVRLAGSIAHGDLPMVYAAADVYVLASHYESFGLVGLEALACGRPVISTRVGIMAALARMQRPGVIVTDGQPAAMATAIAALANGTPDWPPQVIRETAQDFSWAEASSAALAAYREAIQTHASISDRC